MGRHRRQFTGAFKAKIALEAIKGQRTVQELATGYGVHPNQITNWRKQLVAAAPDIFSGERERRGLAEELEKDELYRQTQCPFAKTLTMISATGMSGRMR